MGLSDSARDGDAVSDRDLNVRISFGDFVAFVNAEGVSYAPDALDDMAKRCLEMFREGYAIVRADMVDLADDDEDAEAVTGDDEA